MSVTANGLTELQREFAQRAPERMAKLASQTLNRALPRGRTRLVRVVTGSINLPAAYVREQITLRNATPAKLEAAMSARKRPVQLSRFDARRVLKAGQLSAASRERHHDEQARASAAMRPAGVTVKVRKGGARETLPGAFIIRLRSSNSIGVALRAKVGDKRAGRKPIDVLYGPSLDQIYRRVRPELQAEMGTYVRDELQRRVAQTVLGK